MAKNQPDTRKNRFDKIFKEFNIEKGGGKRKEILGALKEGASAKDLYKFLKKKTGTNSSKSFAEFAAKHPKAFPSYSTEIKTPTREEALKDLYSSDEFLMLSPENQQIVRSTIDSYSVADLQNLKITKKEADLITKQAQQAAQSEYGYSRKQLNQDYEQSLAQEVSGLERALESQKAQLANDDAVTAQNRQMLIQDTQKALEEAKSRYEIEAQRKNDWLQNQLEDISVQLEKATGRADEDKILQLRSLERQYNATLRNTQNNMAQRGLTFSGIRAKAEEDLGSEYEDSMTTAELIADRQKADAERAAYEQQRNAQDLTNQDLQDLLYKYGTIQKGAVQNAESQLGTTDTSQIIGNSNISGAPTASSYLYGGLLGTNAITQQQQQQQYKDYMGSQYAQFESQYGTDALKAAQGYDSSLYNPTGNITGYQRSQYNQNVYKLKQQKAVNQKTAEQALQEKALLSKMI